MKTRGWLLVATLSLPLHAAEPPSPELLEFLGEWTDDKGAAIDPFALPSVAEKKTNKKESGDDDEQDAR